MEVAVLAVCGIAYGLFTLERIPSFSVALGCAVVLLGMQALSPAQAWAALDWNTLFILFSSFVIMAALSDSGVFPRLTRAVSDRSQRHPERLFIFLPLLAGVLSTVINNITVIIFLGALSLELSAVYDLDPAALMMAEVCCANTGGGLTILGSSSNLIMANALGFGFTAVVVHMVVPISLSVAGFIYFFWKRSAPGRSVNPAAVSSVLPADPPVPVAEGSALAALLALGTLVAVLAGSPSIALAGFRRISIGGWALLPAVFLLIRGAVHRKCWVRQADVETLLFFVGMFIMVGALQSVGFFERCARLLGVLHQPRVMILVVLWMSAILSALLDNIPMALATACTLKALPGSPVQTTPNLVWAALLGLTVGGNMTPLGASANLVAYQQLRTRGKKIGWGSWIRWTAAPSLTILAFLSVYLWMGNR